MSIRINNKIIAGNGGETKSTSYRYVGEIFQSTIPIDDIKVACLDGHKIYADDGYGSFIQYLISQSLIYPQIVCTEEEWQEKVGQYGSWGKFVINTQENSVRLPKIAGFLQGTVDINNLADLIEAGLPNIEGDYEAYFVVAGANKKGTGALANNSTGEVNLAGCSTANCSRSNLNFDASLSNSIYGNSNTVQPQAIQYPYYIVLATGVVQEINIKDEVHLNNPFFFGMYQYFETEPNNLSWLKSEGQWNIGDIYESFYKWLVESYNNTDSGVSVKLHTETYTNFDYVLNQDNKTFRLPIEVKQKFYNDISGSIPVAGNGMTLGVTDGTNNYGLYQNSTIGVSMNTNLYGTEAGTITGSTGNSGKNIGITTDPTKSGIEAQITQTEIESLGLYFYVGETVEGANVINGKKVLDILPKKIEKEDIYKGIANCLLEVPQNIKLELKDGVLTLKAGSKVVVPNGFEEDGVTPKFDYLTISKDMNIVSGNLSRNLSLFYRNGSYQRCETRLAFSGTTAPTTASIMLWYDTANNLVKFTNDKGVTWVSDNISLPFSLVKETDSGWASIDQVFNGFGFVGSTIWADKGTKYLIPNGRNKDGTLKNIEYTFSEIRAQTNTSSFTGDILLAYSQNGYVSWWTKEYFTESDTVPTPTYSTWRWLNTRENKLYYTTDTGATWKTAQYSILGWCNLTSGKITEFYPKTTFRAVDYNDIQSLLSSGGSSGGGVSVVDSYEDGDSGYVVYSDGYCRQWGKVDFKNSRVNNLSVSYYKKLKNNFVVPFVYTVVSGTLKSTTTLYGTTTNTYTLNNHTTLMSFSGGSYASPDAIPMGCIYKLQTDKFILDTSYYNYSDSLGKSEYTINSAMLYWRTECYLADGEY